MYFQYIQIHNKQVRRVVLAKYQAFNLLQYIMFKKYEEIDLNNDYQDADQILISIHSSDCKQIQKEKQQHIAPSIQQKSPINPRQSLDFADFNDNYGMVEDIIRKYSNEDQNTQIKTIQNSNHLNIYSEDSFACFNESIEDYPINQSIPIVKKPDIVYVVQKDVQNQQNRNKNKKNNQKNIFQSDLMKFDDTVELNQPEIKKTCLPNQKEKVQPAEIIKVDIQLLGPKNKRNKGNNEVEQNYNLADVLNMSLHMNSGIKGLVKKKQSQSIEIVKMGDTFFYKDENREVQIDYNLMNYLAEYFLQKKVLIPLVDETVFKCQHFNQFIHKLTQFLQNRKLDLFKKGIQSLAGKMKNMKKQKQQHSVFSYLNFKIFQKKKYYSKVQIIRQSFLSKLQTLRLIQNLTETKVTEEIDEVLDTLGSLQLLLCFERAENYCQEKSIDPIQRSTWKNRQSDIIIQRNWWITHHFKNLHL